MTQRFRYYLRVRYQECDAQKVVFNARYGDYIDLACIEFLRAALPRPEHALDGTFEIQSVRQLTEWKTSGPLRRRAGSHRCGPAASAPPRSRSAPRSAGPARAN